MIIRHLKPLKSNSFFLFGARGVGKTTLVNEIFSDDEVFPINLLKQDMYNALLANPEKLTALISKPVEEGKWILIDEVQKVPALLDLVHLHIDQDGARFALTGSSARKLKHGASNLLAGRAFTYKLYPLTSLELESSFEIESALRWGTLPALLKFKTDTERSLYLQSYADTYLKEEIIAEQVIRNLPPFTRFLEVAAQMNTSILNFTKIANDAVTSPSNIKNYFQILEDTLLGFFLQPFYTSVRKRIRQSSKFYFIDCGIQRVLAKHLDVIPKQSSFEYGRLFETFVINQIRTFLEYSFTQYRLSYLMTNSNAEIDLIIERVGKPTLLIEIKSGKEIRETQLSTLKKISMDIENSIPLCLCQTDIPKKMNQVEVLPWGKVFDFLS